MRQIIPATILASESFVNAKNSHLTLSSGSSTKLPPGQTKNAACAAFRNLNPGSAKSGVETEFGPTAFGVSLGFSATLLRGSFKGPEAPHFIEDALRVELAFQPLERAIHRFAFSNYDFWHQFTSILRNFARFIGRPRVYYVPRLRVKSPIIAPFEPQQPAFSMPPSPVSCRFVYR